MSNYNNQPGWNPNPAFTSPIPPSYPPPPYNCTPQPPSYYPITTDPTPSYTPPPPYNQYPQDNNLLYSSPSQNFPPYQSFNKPIEGSFQEEPKVHTFESFTDPNLQPVEESKDKTANFESLYQIALSPDGAKKLISETNLDDYEIVLISDSNKDPNYMKCHVEYLQDLGLSVRSIPIDSSASLESNALLLNNQITEARSPKKSILVGHSKGGTSVAAALALFPRLQDFVESAVCMQSPFGGSRLTNELLAQAPSPVRMILKGLLSKLKLDSAESSQQTSQFFQQHSLNGLSIPLVNLITSSSSKHSLLYPLMEFIKHKYGEENDGMVSTKDASIDSETSYIIKLDGIDHEATAYGSEDSSKGLGSKIGHLVSSYKVEILVLVIIVIAVLIAIKMRKRRRQHSG